VKLHPWLKQRENFCLFLLSLVHLFLHWCLPAIQVGAFIFSLSAKPKTKTLWHVDPCNETLHIAGLETCIQGIIHPKEGQKKPESCCFALFGTLPPLHRQRDNTTLLLLESVAVLPFLNGRLAISD
jgi:hypothetical protein